MAFVRSPRSRFLRRTTVLVSAGAVLAAALSTVPAGAAAGSPASAGSAASVDSLSLLDAPVGFSDLDARAGSLLPSAAQLSAVASLGATARWNKFGTPESLIAYGGYLGTGYHTDARGVARAWLRDHAPLFKLSPASVDALTVVSDQKLAGGAGHSVLYRQKFGSLNAAQDGLIAVAVRDDKVYYVSSSAAGDLAAPPAATLSPVAAWLKAAANVGRPTASASVGATATDGSWTTFTVPGFAQAQRARLVAVPLYTSGPRPAYETIVLDNQSGRATAYTVFVDAITGAVLMRYNRVDNDVQNNVYTAAFTPTGCGVPVPGATVDAATKSITVTATASVPANDIALNLVFHNAVVASTDTGVAQEVLRYAPGNGVPAGDYFVQICPSAAPAAPLIAPYTAQGTISSDDTATPSASVPYPPKWNYFVNAPQLDYSSTDTRITGCWVTSVGGTTVPGCTRKEQNLASRFPWDVEPHSNTPTFTTFGNNANTAESWGSPLTPSAPGQRPVSATRTYQPAWTNQWTASKCDPTSFAPTGNNVDVQAAVTNLFVGHNRFHDFSYFLGFTEENYNAQLDNFGNTPATQEKDNEIGNVQAGALDGGFPSFEGRDNANQIALNDGISPITNQYLFQPIAGAFYASCSDGDFDTTVFGHEYTHLISNRMVGGPDDNLTGAQAGSMGESWSDLDALEYLHEFGYIPQNGENDWAEGPYVTGNKKTGIRNYGLNANPLNYGDIGYDLTGAEVHADGEIWNAVNYDIRQALAAKYNASFPSTDAALNLRCATGVLPADQCPGNRRWLQLVYDGWLLQPAADSMLDARDSYLAADMMRFGGANQAELWTAFAKRGFGRNASTTGTDDVTPTPGFVGLTGSKAGSVAFTATAMDQAGQPKIAGLKLYVGPYTARVHPVAVTDTAGRATFSAEPGSYLVSYQVAGYGIHSMTVTVPANATTTQAVHLVRNLASSTNGATATGGPSATTTAGLIDDTEATDWTDSGSAAVNTTTPGVTVHLAGTANGPVPVRSVRVSALLNAGQNRFTALRQFAIQTCTESATNPGCTLPAGFTTIYTSSTSAFPSGLPRPLAPDLLIRTFDVPDTMATHVRLVALNSQCTGGPAYQGDQDNDPTNNSDCVTGSAASPLIGAKGNDVSAAELEVYSFDNSTRPPGDPVVALAMTAPATATTGSTVSYVTSYTNLGPQPSAHAVITDHLPLGVHFVSAGDGGVYNSTTRTVTWSLGTVAVTYTGTVHLTVQVTGAAVGSVILNQAGFTGDLTVGLPGAAGTTVL